MTTDQNMCPRCADTDISVVGTSPIPNVWEILRCGACGYLWRTTEPARRSQRDAYPEAFRLTAADIAAAVPVPVVPPLETSL